MTRSSPLSLAIVMTKANITADLQISRASTPSVLHLLTTEYLDYFLRFFCTLPSYYCTQQQQHYQHCQFATWKTLALLLPTALFRTPDVAYCTTEGADVEVYEVSVPEILTKILDWRIRLLIHPNPQVIRQSIQIHNPSIHSPSILCPLLLSSIPAQL